MATVQTAGGVDVMVTGNPDVAVATKTGVATPMVWSPGDANVMLCVCRAVPVPLPMPLAR